MMASTTHGQVLGMFLPLADIVIPPAVAPAPRGMGRDDLAALAVALALVTLLLVGAGVQALKRSPPGAPRRLGRLAALTLGFWVLLLLAALVAGALVVATVPVTVPDLLGDALIVGGPALGSLAVYAWLDRRHRLRTGAAEASGIPPRP